MRPIIPAALLAARLATSSVSDSETDLLGRAASAPCAAAAAGLRGANGGPVVCEGAPRTDRRGARAPPGGAADQHGRGRRGAAVAASPRRCTQGKARGHGGRLELGGTAQPRLELGSAAGGPRAGTDGGALELGRGEVREGRGRGGGGRGRSVVLFLGHGGDRGLPPLLSPAGPRRRSLPCLTSRRAAVEVSSSASLDPRGDRKSVV